MGARAYAYSWPGVDGTIEAQSEAQARALIRAKHQLKWVPNGAKVVRMDGTPHTPPLPVPEYVVPEPVPLETVWQPMAVPEGLSEKDRFAFYRRTAPREDLLFIRRNASAELQTSIDALLAGKPTAKDATQMRERRRMEMAEAERAANIPPVGSPRWHQQVDPIWRAEREALIAAAKAEREAAEKGASDGPDDQ